MRSSARSSLPSAIGSGEAAREKIERDKEEAEKKTGCRISDETEASEIREMEMARVTETDSRVLKSVFGRSRTLVKEAKRARA